MTGRRSAGPAPASCRTTGSSGSTHSRARSSRWRQGRIGLVANAHYLAMTVGCCSDYQVDVLDLTQRSAQVKILTRPPDQPALFTEGAGPGVEGLIAVRGAATGAWYFLNPSLGVLNAF